jgi:hypothetical protein
MAPPTLWEDQTELVHFAKVEAALHETPFHLPPRLAWQMASNGGSSLVVRRLIVAPRGIKSGDAAGGPVRSLKGRKGYQSQHYADGCVYGATLGNLVQHCTGSKYRTMHAMRALRRVLAPAGRALASCKGVDVAHLVRSMACHRVIKVQGKRLPELKRCKPIDKKLGPIGVALGVTAAVLTAFECMALDKEDSSAAVQQLTTSLRQALACVETWRIPDMQGSLAHDARHAEQRALERALMGVARAQHRGSELDPVEQLRLQLDCARRAVWPEGEQLCAEAHGSLCERIRSGELVDLERDQLVAGAITPGVATLVSLPLSGGVPPTGRTLAVRDPDAGSSSASDGIEAESLFGGSSASWSSWSSAGSMSSAGSTGSTRGAQLDPQTLGQLANALNATNMSEAARSAAAPPMTISSSPQPC